MSSSRAAIIAALALLLMASRADAACSTVTVTNVATTVFAASDLSPQGTNRIFAIQNNNPTGVAIWCAKGTAGVNSGNYLAAAGGQWVETVPLPQDQVTCITQSGSTSVYACDYAQP